MITLDDLEENSNIEAELRSVEVKKNGKEDKSLLKKFFFSDFQYKKSLSILKGFFYINEYIT